MTETWDLLAASTRQRQLCASDVDQLKQSCEKEHSKKHVVECRECYPKLIERMRSRYIESKDQEWFSRRGEFMEELDRLFTEAKDDNTKLEAIDSRIKDEQRRWYLESVKFAPGVRRALEDVHGRRDVLSKAGDKRVSFEEVVDEIRRVMGQDVAGEQEIETMLGQLMTEQPTEEHLRVYRETFFQANPAEGVTEKSQRYLDRLRAGSSMEMIVNQILSDRRSSMGAPDQKAKHRKRIEELRRARTAHETQKAKKKSGRQGSTQSVHPPDAMYDLPPCDNCRKIPDTKDFHVCVPCQILVDAGIRDTPTVFCSLTCSDHGLDIHTERAHPGCASGDDCVQLFDEDVEMDMNGSGGGCFLCRECTGSLKIESIYCSLRCADVNFQRHRERIHIPERAARGVVGQVETEDDLVFENEDKSRYHAKDIGLYLMPLMDALREFQHRNGIETLSVE